MSSTGALWENFWSMYNSGACCYPTLLTICKEVSWFTGRHHWNLVKKKRILTGFCSPEFQQKTYILLIQNEQLN